MEQIKLKDLFIGKIDAKNELIENTEEAKNRFFNSYLLPDNIIIEDFYKGSRYYITGLKGTGKTALLRYISLSVEKKYNANTSFILFKSEFSNEDKKAFARALSNTVIALKNEDNENEDDFANIWHWFIHRHIIKIIKNGVNNFFEENSNWEKYERCVLAPKLGDEKSGVMHLFPKLKKGNVELEGDFDLLKGKLGLDFEWENVDSKQVKFSSIVKQADELYKKLQPKNQNIFVFVDELELTLGKQKQYQKDVRLIRDLIIAINNFNSLSRSLKFPIYIITAIRSEVLSSIQSSGKEINKLTSDFGVILNWHQALDSSKNHPLIKIINKKIQASEQLFYGNYTESIDELWSKYFPGQLYETTPQEAILHLTWYRPRDIVRLLGIAQQQYPYETRFSSQIFEKIRKDYSTQSWIEHIEELRTKYSEEEIEGIQKLLKGLSCPFNLNQITVWADQKRTHYAEVDNLLTNHKIGDILSLLYKVGIIGNTGVKVRYSFRGDDELLIEKNMKVHDPLWNFLSTEKREYVTE
jgi:hypothetical protein